MSKLNWRSRMCMALLLGVGSSGPILAGEDKATNVGEDFTRPLGRVDLRWTYQDRVANQQYDELTVRFEQPFNLSEKWTLNTRFDLPGIYKNLPSVGQEKWGLGDLDVQLGLIRKLDARYSVGGGVRSLFPTASADRFGTGKYRLVVGGGFRAILSEISSGSFIAPQIQYEFDVAGDSSRQSISRLKFLPTLHIALPYGQFVTFLSSGDLRYDFQLQKWFLPIDATYGKRWEDVIISLQASYPIVDDSGFYEAKTELRIGYFF